MSGHRKKPTDRDTLTSWGRQRVVLVRTWKETGQPRHTHKLETAEGETWSGHRKKPTDRGALTNWRRQKEGLVRTQKETDRPKCTHFLKMAEGGTCQGTKRNRPTEAHLHPGDGRGRNLSGHRKKPTDRGALTSWRRQREGLVKTWKEPTD